MAAGGLTEAIAADGPGRETLTQRAGALRAAFGALREATGAALIDVHGDLHVGQILRSPSPRGDHSYAVTV